MIRLEFGGSLSFTVVLKRQDGARCGAQWVGQSHHQKGVRCALDLSLLNNDHISCVFL